MSKISALFLAAATCLNLAFAGTNAWESELLGEGLKLEATQKQEYIKARMAEFFDPAKPAAAPFIAPKDWEYEKFNLNGLKMERLQNHEAKTERVILQLHGGGYVLGLSDLYRKLAVKHAILADAKQIYLTDYRLAPRHVYPAALNDALSAYEEALRRGVKPAQIIVVGDSAGGNLALALALKLKERDREQPAALVLISPWTTFEASLPSRTLNAELDAVLGKSNAFMYNEVAKPSYAGNLSLSDPRLSPINADLSGLAPMLIQTGGFELFLDEDIELAKKAARDGVSVNFSVYAGMPHVFAIRLPQLRESAESFLEFKNFIDLKLER